MTSPLRYALTLTALLSLCMPAAHATDIDCDPSTSSPNRPPSHRLICESALFSMGYQRIHADQQRQLRAGAILEADVAAFRDKRDHCDAAACLDAVFREWNARRRQAR